MITAPIAPKAPVSDVSPPGPSDESAGTDFASVLTDTETRTAPAEGQTPEEQQPADAAASELPTATAAPLELPAPVAPTVTAQAPLAEAPATAEQPVATPAATPPAAPATAPQLADPRLALQTAPIAVVVTPAQAPATPPAATTTTPSLPTATAQPTATGPAPTETTPAASPNLPATAERPQAGTPAPATPALPTGVATAPAESTPAAQTSPQPQQATPQQAAPPAAAPAPAPVATPAAPALPQLPRLSPIGVAQAVERVHDLVKLSSDHGVTRAQLDLHPSELGSVEVNLRTTRDGLVASMTAADPAAHEALTLAGAELRRTLEERGITLARLDIHLAAGGQDGHGTGQTRRDASQRRAQADGIDATEATGDDLLTPTIVTTLPAGALVDVRA